MTVFFVALASTRGARFPRAHIRPRAVVDASGVRPPAPMFAPDACGRRRSSRCGQVARGTRSRYSCDLGRPERDQTSRVIQASGNCRVPEIEMILADALQDAGCENADVLTHCRGDGPH